MSANISGHPEFIMTEEEYEQLNWPARTRLARMALPKSTKTALAAELRTTVHTVMRWENGESAPNHRFREGIKALCLRGMSPDSAGMSIDFLLGGFDANEKVLTAPLLTRDKSTATVALLAIATRIACHVYYAIPKEVFVSEISTIFNTYPSAASVIITPVEYPKVKFVIRVSHLPAGVNYTLELISITNNTPVSRYMGNVSDRNISEVVRLLKKLFKTIK